MWRIIAYDRDGREVTRMELEGGEITIGRDTDRQMVLPSASVSRKHAKVVLNPPTPFIVDEGSANGVIVNGVRITQPTAIAPGVRVDIAEFHLEFEQQQATNTGFTEAVAPIADRPAAYDESDVVRLVANGGPFDGRIYDIPPGELGVGRAVDNDLVLDDPSLSRKHARIRRAGIGRIELEDLGSSNGSYVNGRKVGRGTAGPGDTVRFGDLIFRVQGARSDGTRANTAGGAGKGLLIGALIGLVLLAGGGAAVYFLVLKKPAGTSGGGKAAGDPTEQIAQHIASGKAKLADKKYEAAAAEFDAALDLDPTNADARRLKNVASSEPDNEKTAKSIRAKVELGDRASFEQALRMLGRIPDESVSKEPTAKTVAMRLTAYGENQCKGRKWADCAWAICKAREVAPDDAKPGPDADAALKDAEKKLAKDKTYTPCKKK